MKSTGVWLMATLIVVTLGIVVTPIITFANPPSDYRVPINGYYRLNSADCDGHQGQGRFMDINGWGGGNTDQGDPIYAAGGGTVTYVGFGPSTYGNNVRIDSNEVTFRYAHLDKTYAISGTVVTEGDLLGLMGGTPHFSPHLHWEAWNTNLGPDDRTFNIFDIPGVNLETDCGNGPDDYVNGDPTISGYNSCEEYAAAHPNYPFIVYPFIVLFDDDHCQGNELLLPVSPNYPIRYNLTVSEDFNDRARSIFIPNGWSALVGGNINDEPYTLTRCLTSSTPGINDLDNTIYDTRDPLNRNVWIGYHPWNSNPADPFYPPSNSDGWDMISYITVSQNSNCSGTSTAVGGYTYTRPSGGTDTVEIFDEQGCTGTKYGWHDPTGGWVNAADYLDNKASCVVVSPGWSVLVSENEAGEGGKRCFTETNPDLHFATYDIGTNINDSISSLNIYNDSTCAGQATMGLEPGDTVTVWEEGWYGGLKYGWHDTGVFNVPDYLANNIYSIGIMPGWSAAVYELPNAGGGVRCYSSSDFSTGEALSNATSANRNIESVRIFHDSVCGGNLWMAELRPTIPEGNEQPLVVSSVIGTSSSDTLIVGQPAYVDYVVENSGNATAYSAHLDISLWLDDQLVDRKYHWIIEPGQTVGITDFEINVTEVGWHTLKLVIDGESRIDEYIESNNVWESDFYWGGDVYEPDDNNSQASVLPFFPTIPDSHSIIPSTDVDWATFQITSPSLINLLANPGSPFDIDLRLYDSNLNQIAIGSKITTPFPVIQYRCDTNPLSAGTYYVKIEDNGNDNEIPSYVLLLESYVCPSPFSKASPSNGAVLQAGNTILIWQPSSLVTNYQYCYDTQLDNACSNWIDNGVSTAATINTIPNSDYEWHVRAYNGSSVTYSNGSSTAFWNFSTGGTPSGFSKTTPVDKSAYQPTNLRLTWTESQNASGGYDYCIDLTNDDICDNDIWNFTGMNTHADLANLEPGTPYYWTVRARNEFGTTFADSGDWWEFVTAAPATIGAFGKTTPANGVTGQSNCPVLSWQQSANATEYKYCLDGSNDNTCNPGGGQPLWPSTGAATSVRVYNLPPGTPQYWQARASNASSIRDANSNVWWKFTVKPFVKFYPKSGVTGVPRRVTLTWAHLGCVARYEYCIDTVNNNRCDTQWVSTGGASQKTLSLLSSKWYYWQVRAVYSNGRIYYANTNRWWSFKTKR